MNNNMMSNNSEQNNGTNKVVELVVIIIIMFAGIFAFFFYEKGYFDLKKITDDLKDKTQETDKDTEINITNYALKNDLLEKIDYLTGYDSSSNFAYAYNFKNNINGPYGDFFNNFTEDMKLYTVLTYLSKEGKFSRLSSENESNPLISIYTSLPNVEIKQIDGKKVNEEYKLFFGKDIATYKSLDGCPMFPYDNDLNIFFWYTPQCSESTSGIVYAFANKFSFNGDYAYVYVSYGSAKNYESKDKYTIYKNLGEKDSYESNITVEEAMNFEIDESNYKDFLEYKFTFKKDSNGNYYFEKVEPTK